MDELIHHFLLQSGYPRASIVTDVSSVVGTLNGTLPNFIIVDPETADRLAVITVVDAVEEGELHDYAAVTGNAANRLGGRAVQGYVIRVDVDGANEAEQVQFYRVWPNSELQQLSARTFPDLDSLRVGQKIALQAIAAESELVPIEASQSDMIAESYQSMGMGAYIPGIVLALVATGDLAANFMFGGQVLGLPQSLMLVGAAVLLSVPAMLRFQKGS